MTLTDIPLSQVLEAQNSTNAPNAYQPEATVLTQPVAQSSGSGWFYGGLVVLTVGGLWWWLSRLRSSYTPGEYVQRYQAATKASKRNR